MRFGRSLLPQVLAAFTLFFFTSLAIAAEKVEFGSVVNGQITIKGSGFTKRTHDSSGEALKVVVIQSFKQLGTTKLNANGSFSYTTKKEALEVGRSLWVEVVMYENQSANWVSDHIKVPDLGGSDPQPEPPTYDPEAAIDVKLENGLLTVTGRKIVSGHRSSFRAIIQVNGTEIGRTDVSSGGTFKFTAKDRAKGRDTVKVIVENYKGDNLDLVLSEKIPYWYNSDAEIEFTDFVNDQLTITGHLIENNVSERLRVRVSTQNRTLKEIETNSNGSFSYTTPRGDVQPGDKLTVQVTDFRGSGEHLIRTHQIPILYNPDARIEWGRFEDGQITIVGRDLQRKDGRELTASIKIVRSSRHLELRDVRINSNGSFSFTSPRGDVQCGDRLVVTVDNYYDARRDFTADRDLPRAGNGCFDWIPDQKLRQYAQTQARIVFERLALAYGARENYRAYFADGFWQGLETGRNNRATIIDGENRGRLDAQEPGVRAGHSQAQRHADAVALADARARFQAVLDGATTSPDLTVRVPSVQFERLDGGDPYHFDLDFELRNLDSSTRYEYARNWSEAGLQVDLSTYENPFNLMTVYSLGGIGRYRVDLGWSSPEWAFRGWENQRFGFSFDHRLYSELGSTQKSDLKSYFQRAFEEVADSNRHLWRSYNGDALARGERIGLRLGETIARNVGLSDGYRRGFSESAEQTAQRVFGDLYRTEFGTAIVYLPKAMDAGRIAGDRVVKTYGQREIFIRDLYKGFAQSYEAGREVNEGNPRYGLGLESGRVEAVALGRETGTRVARERTQPLIPGDVRLRFETAVEDGTRRPDLEPRTPALVYEGDTATRSGVDLTAIIGALRAPFVQELSQNVKFEDGGLSIGFSAASAPDLATLYNGGQPGEYVLRQAFLEGEYGVIGLRENSLGELDYATAAGLSSTHRSNYERLFAASYAKEARHRFAGAVVGTSPAGAAVGSRYGLEIGGSHAEATGRNDGFNKSYRAASIAGFNEVLPAVYADQFHLEARKYKENAVLVLKRASLIDGSGNLIFEANEKVGVKLNEVVNLGMVDATNVAYTLTGPSLVVPREGAARTAVNIPALSKAKDVMLPNLAQIARGASERQTHTVRFTFAGEGRDLKFRMGWAALIEQYAFADVNDLDQAPMREAILGVIAQDWINHWLKRWLGWDDRSSMLGQLVTAYERLPRDARGLAARQRLMALHDDIAKIPPARPSSKERRHKDAFLKMAALLKR